MQSEYRDLIVNSGKTGREGTNRPSGLPEHVVIVGGSLAGLMHGIQLKRHGSRVTILEQDSRDVRRQTQAAGIGFGANMKEFLRRYDITGQQVSLPLGHMRISFGTRAWDWCQLPVQRDLTSWAHLYRVLRANLVTEEGDLGSVDYRAGKRVDGLLYPDRHGGVTAQFTDVETGLRDSVSADLLIGADGIHSTIQRLVGAPVRKEHADYVVWRGTVPEDAVSSETARFFASAGAAEMMWKSYMICYTIPTDTGCFEPGHRVINWLWYYNVSEGSQEMIDILTDIDGRQHNQTVPAGRVRAEVWARHRETMLPYMARPYAELVNVATSPFVTRVTDSISQESIFYDGRVVLAGDAYAAVRPHLAAATDHAAWQCLSMMDLWTARVSKHEWSRRLNAQTTRLWLQSRLLGLCGQGLWLTFFKTAWLYIVFLATQGLKHIWG